MIRIFITDDQKIIQNGLLRIVSEDEEIEVIGVFNNGEELMEGLSKELPDVLLLDIQMPGLSGIELAGIISKQYPSVKIIGISNIDVVVQVKKMLQQGSTGYLLKDASPDVILNAIHTAYGGGKVLDANLQQQIISGMFDSRTNHEITRREKEILKLITEEFTNQEIADQLFISLRTVENHRNNLLQKLGVKNTAGLVRAAIQEGLID